MTKKTQSSPIGKNEVLPSIELQSKRVRANPGDLIEFTFFLKSKESGSPLPQEEHLHDIESEHKKVVSRRAYNNHHTSHPDAILEIKKFAKLHHFEVVDINELERWVNCTGKIKDVEKAFDIDIKASIIEDKVYHFYENEISLPNSLGQYVESVSGIHDFPVKAQKIFPKEITLSKSFVEGKAVFPQNFAKMYNFPEGLDGTGQTIAIISLGGGYSKKVLEAYFKKVGIPMPNIKWTSVDGGKNNLKGKIQDIYEVYMDIEIAGALAPGAKIVVYFANNSRANIAKAIKRAIHDKKNRPTIISMSWGALEKEFDNKERDLLNRTLHEAAALNITVITSSGDFGSSGAFLEAKSALNVQLPASNPFVTAVGGTELHEDNGMIIDEHSWEQKQTLNDFPVNLQSGGGFSDIWGIPGYQKTAIPSKLAKMKHRGLPDVAANASTDPGILLLVGDLEQISMGTSAATPLWAALIARINQSLNQNGYSNVGFLNPLLYHDEIAKTFNPVDRGSNGKFKAGKGWDPTTGLGTPNGKELLKAIMNYKQAKKPKSKS